MGVRVGKVGESPGDGCDATGLPCGESVADLISQRNGRLGIGERRQNLSRQLRVSGTRQE